MKMLTSCFLCALYFSLVLRDSHAQEKPSVALHQHGREILIEVQGRRLLEDTLQRLSQEYGWLIDFEEHVYTDDQMVDVTAASWRRDHPKERGAFDPRFETAEFILSNEVLAEGATERALQALLVQYNAKFPKQRYLSQQLGKNRYVVYGVRDGDSPEALNPAILVPPALNPLSGSQELNRVVSTCSSQNKFPIVIATVPANGLATHTIAPAAEKLTCRQAIDRVVVTVNPNLVYRLAYGSGDRQLYLNIVSADKYQTTPDGQRVLRPRN